MGERFLPPYRVLDLADEGGAFCGKLLADFGADVIKVEPPGGDPARGKAPLRSGAAGREVSLDFLAFNTNKRSLTLDIRHPRGRACLIELARKADAVIETFPVGTMDRLGLGYGELRERNPGLVMVSITPYGQSGPRCQHHASDLIVMATSGIMQVTGEPGGPPTRLGNEQSRFAAALYAALGGLAALLERDWHRGRGQHVDVSMQEALITFYLEQHPVLCWSVRQRNVTRVGPVSSLAVPAGVFPCRDGWIGLGIFTAAEWDTLSRWLYEVTGCEEILAEELRGGIHARAAHRDLIEAVLLDFMMQQTRAELFREGQRRNLVVAPVNTVADVLEEEVLAGGAVWKTLDHPVVGPLRYPLSLLGAELPTAGRAAPLPGEANEAILSGELGLSRQELEALRAEGVIGPCPPAPAGEGRETGRVEAPPVPPRPTAAARQAPAPPAAAMPSGEARGDANRACRLLDGVRVVEFGRFIALPLTGRLLAALGATVIKVETNKLPDELVFVPPWGPGMGQPEYQALKRRVTLDVRLPEGAALFKRLLAASDVFLTNFRRDALARWGLGLAELRSECPRLVIVHQTGFGAGPYEHYKLYGIMAQHCCGVSLMSGLPDEGPCCLNSAYSDYHTPILQAFGVLGALERRRAGAGGALIEGSIFHSSLATVAGALLAYQATGCLPARRCNHDAVAVPHNAYRCRGEDEWCAIAVWTEEQWRALCAVLGHPEWGGDGRFATAAQRRAHEAELDALLGEATRGRDKHELEAGLQAAGVPAGIVAKGGDLAGDPHLSSRRFYTPTTYYVPDVRQPGTDWKQGPDVPMGGVPILFSDTPCRAGPYRRIGEDNDYVYGELLGLSREEIRRLAERGVLS